MSGSKYLVHGVVVITLFAVSYYIVTNSGRKTTVISVPKESIEAESMRPESRSSSMPQIVDNQASFAIFTNGTFRVFTATMYHNLSPDVFIEANNPHLIQIKKDGLTWNDFFSTLPLKLTRDCLTTGTGQTFCSGSKDTLKFYINATRYEDALNNKINQSDKLLITYGNETEEQIQKQLDKLNSQ